MKRKNLVIFLLLTTSILLAFAVQPRSKAAALLEKNDLPPLELVGAASVASKPNSMIIRCEGYHCGRYDELVYWGFDNKIYFLDARSLTPTGSPLLTSSAISSIRDERFLFYDRYYQQIYALDKYDEGSYPNGWYRLEARIIRGYKYVASVPINKAFNAQTPVDRYYHIDGAALQQPTVNPGALARIFVDNPVNGTVDTVTFDGHTPGISQTTRLSYRDPLACATNPSYCSWTENQGSSLAVDATDTVYIADNNDLADRIVVRGGAKPNIDNVGSLFYCFVNEAGISMAPEENVLYLPAGCQSFADGGVAQLDTTGNGNHHVIDLPYYDQGLIVDWSDQKRVFIATTDFDGNYDPERHLYLHLLYDGQLIATLPVMVDYARNSLTAMAFDPYANMLYLAVETTIYMVRVNYGGSAGFPPLPAGELVITPHAAHDLIANDSSAIFHFAVGAVDENTRVSYQELPPMAVPDGKLATMANAGTELHTVRQFELTAVISDTATPLARFNAPYQLKLYYSPREIALIVGGNKNIQLYQWDGSGWQQAGSTYGSSSENLLYISADLTGRFAILGPTYKVYLPVVLSKKAG
ncbi:MAG: hypothetical protein JW850_07035 [Thermoflexales bacterium]|nr:hypothetical protein [Thermoflexales bacterium]